jgi:hypothetical protein
MQGGETDLRGETGARRMKKSGKPGCGIYEYAGMCSSKGCRGQYIQQDIGKIFTCMMYNCKAAHVNSSLIYLPM